MARSYCLLFPLLAGVAAVYKKRYDRPVLFFALLVLIAATSSYGIIIAGSFAANETLMCVMKYIFKKDRGKEFKPGKRYFVSFGLSLAAMLAFGLYVLPPKDSLFSVPLKASLSEFFGIIVRTFAVDLKSLPLNAAACVLIIAFFAVYFRGQLPTAAFLSSILFGYMFLFYARDWHCSCLFLLVAALMIIFRPQAKGARRAVINAGLCVLLLTQAAGALRCAAFDVGNAYSGSMAAAEFLKPYVDAGCDIRSLDFSGTAVQPYFEKNIFSNHPGEDGYYFWSENNGYDYKADGSADIYVLGSETQASGVLLSEYTCTSFEGKMCFENRFSEDLTLSIYVRNN